MIEGFCYHCLSCDFNTMFQEPAIEHSKIGDYHTVKRFFRDNCLIHRKMLQTNH